ncbi:MAG: hypothetical protein QOC96_2011 [Acidobacteriota bacterium]|jgi:hypothetical protein|nr:hypothetical protein [Acidobacteriota bacterium]
MSKTIVSAFDNRQQAARLLDSAIASGFDSSFFSVIGPAEKEATMLQSLVPDVPGIQARVYQKHLRMGDSLLVAQVAENDVQRLIRLLQSTGGQHIEAFDRINAA